MRLNESTIIVGRDVFLVPYRKEHVPKYHEWMKDPAIREATASEPLTLEQEYEMQRTWHLDEDKSRDSSHTEDTPPASLSNGMIGDVNLFLSPVEVQTEEETTESPRQAISEKDDPCLQGELEIMIAEPLARRKGIASQAVTLMMAYASAPPLSVKPQHFFVRIGTKNEGSIRMFEKLGFEIVKETPIFQEVELRLKANAADALARDVGSIRLVRLAT